MKKNAVVIARYNEDINWINQLEDVDIYIYNKSEDLVGIDIPDIPNTIIEHLPNNFSGRDAHTHVYHICKYYDKDYETITFLQGHPFDHCPHTVPYVNYKCKNLIDYNNIIKDLNDDQFCRVAGNFVELGYMATCLSVEWGHGLDVVASEISLPVKVLTDKNELVRHFPAGIQFIVNKSACIDNKSLLWWKNLLEQIGDRSEWGYAHALERLFPAIWDYNECDKY
jgi:hypothetical protein